VIDLTEKPKQRAATMLAHAWDYLYDICPGIGTGRELRGPKDFLEWKANTEARHEIYMILRRHFTPKEREAQL
jgi:hypothetical protein